MIENFIDSLDTPILPSYKISDSLHTILQINGIPLEMLENKMRPAISEDMETSSVGFIGKEEHLKDILIADDILVKSLGFTHEQLAYPIQYIINEQKANRTRKLFPYNGVSYNFEIIAFAGEQYSPFKDDMKTHLDGILKRSDTDEQIRFSFLMPHFISAYGFYEGKSSPYRLEPETIIRFFGLSAK
jgi:hypothetical protein